MRADQDRGAGHAEEVSVKVKVTMYVERLGEDGDMAEYEIEAEGQYYRGSPARTSGDPDTWSDREPPEVELTGLRYEGRSWLGMLSPAEESSALERLAEAALDDEDEPEDE